MINAKLKRSATGAARKPASCATADSGFFCLPADWPATPKEAIALQKTLQGQVKLRNGFKPLRLIGGIDVSFSKSENLTFAHAVLIDAQTMTLLHAARAVQPTRFPYVPGLLSFREAPAILEALNKLPSRPDLLMADGQGIAHPRRLGIAAHLGLITGLPAIGVAKSLLTGQYREPGLKKGKFSILYDGEERIGTVLRSKDHCRPLFVSPGHLVDQDTALAIVQSCLTSYRLPEPTRIADKLSKQK